MDHIGFTQDKKCT